MPRVGQVDSRELAQVWAAAWLKRADYPQQQPGLPSALRRLSAWLWRTKRTAAEPDYYSQLAAIPGVPEEYRVLALAIARHQRSVAAFYRLLTIDDFAANGRTDRAALATPRQTAS